MSTSTKTTEAQPEGKDAAGAGKKKSKKKLLMIALPVVLLVGGGGYVMLGTKKDGPAPKPKPGAVVALEPITVNLADGHFLKLGLALQATATAKEPPDGSKALDVAIDEFSNKSVAQLSSNAARAKYKGELRTKVIEAYEEGKVIMDVYFTEFVMQ